jgi:hemolysin D
MTARTSTLSEEALDFAPGLLAIQESPPARLPRALAYTVFALFAILMSWAIFGRLDIIASADGRLVPQTYVKIVQPADAGIVQEILVKEGQTVQAGQVLMRMDMQIAQAEEKTIETELALKSLQLRRIDAELAGTPMMRGSHEPLDFFRRVEAQYQDHRQSYVDGLQHAQEALRKAQREYDSGKEVLAKLREITPILKAQASAYENVGKEGFAPQVTVQDKQREYLEKARDLAAQESTVESLAAAVAVANQELNQITSKYRSDLQNERADADSQYRKLQQDQIKQIHKSGLLELRAPQAGVVKDLATHTAGTVVSPGTVLLSLVPDNEPLLAEVMVKNDDVGFVFPKQSVKVKLAAYPFQHYGMIDGKVLSVGADATENDPASQVPPRDISRTDSGTIRNYKALVTLDNQALDAQGEKLRLMAGMQVTAEIAEGRRTVMQYLLSPLRKTVYESGREP